MTDWRPPSEIPPLGTLALLAVPLDDDPDDYALLGMYERTPAAGRPFERLVDRRVAAGGKPHSSRVVDRRVAAVNAENQR